jgi:hypothetical protein
LSGGASFFLQKELADLLQELGLYVLPFVGGRTRTYGDEVTSAAETANAEVTAAPSTTTTTTGIGTWSVVIVATWRFGGNDTDQSCRQALQQDKLCLKGEFEHDVKKSFSSGDI